LKIIGYITFLLFLVHQVGFTQTKIALQVSVLDGKELPIKPPVSKPFNTAYEIQLSLKTYLNQLHEEGYLSASIDSISGDSIHQVAFLYVGEKFEWVVLHTDSVDEEILSRTGFRDKQFLNKPFNPKQINRFFENALTYLENTGYPFAEIKLDHVMIDGNQIEAEVILTKNRYYAIDSIEILGEPIRLNKHYIENIIRIKSHQPYEERVIQNIGKRINENPFVEELLPFEVIFTETTCKVVLVLKPKKANLFDGILGVQPQPDNKGVVITGDIKISLGNIVGQGERLNLRWQRLQDQTQEINASLDIPFLFRTPIGFGYSLDIYRKDTTYNNVEQQFTLPFTLYNGSRFRGYFNTFKTSLISTYNYQGDTAIPPFNDASVSTYGVGYSGKFVENKFNPYKGFIIDLQGGAGKNKILKNANLDQVNYDSINLESNLLEGKIKLSYFQPLSRHSTLMIQVHAASKLSDNLVENQLYRIGGLNTLRGFDEQSIFTSSFTIATLEYRFLIDEKSRIIVFTDIGWYEKKIINTFETDMPYGFGAGISFETKVGMFSLNYALGSQFNAPVNFKTGKIHFGFVNFF